MLEHTSTRPAIFFPGASTVDDLELDPFVGPCRLVDLEPLGRRHVEAADLENLVPRETRRVLLRTVNSTTQATDSSFGTDYVALTEGAADWLVAHDVLAVGLDALSIEPFDTERHAVHRRLLGSNVAVIEGLRLADVPSGEYFLACLPLAWVGSDGAPARAALLPLS